MTNSDLSSSILPVGENAVQSSALDDDQDSFSTVASVPPQHSDGSPSSPLNDTLIVPSPVSLDHGECYNTQVTPESESTDDSDDDMWGAALRNDSSGDDNYSVDLRSSKQEPREIGAGLKNLDSNCFINSVLQCFTHTVPLIESLLSYKLQDPCNCGNEKFCVIRALLSHMDVVLRTSEDSVSPSDFVENLQYFSPSFQRGQHEDAYEFLNGFLEKLERCLLDRASDSGDTRSSQGFNFVEHVFGGRLVSELHCSECNSVSRSLERSLGLSLQIEDVNQLSSALDSFTSVEKLEEQMTCSDCLSKVSKEKQLFLDRLPLIATFHLKRFKSIGKFTEKISKHVEYPLELDLAPFMSKSQKNQVSTEYRLYALVEHIGSTNRLGHYCSYVKTAPNTWHKFDDSKVTRTDEKHVLSRESYILFYARKGTPWFSTFYRAKHQLLEASLQSSSPDSVLGECLSEIGYENVDKSNKTCLVRKIGESPCDDSAGVSNSHVFNQDSSERTKKMKFESSDY